MAALALVLAALATYSCREPGGSAPRCPSAHRAHFEQVAGSVSAFVARYVTGLGRPGDVRIRWLDYDWALNDVANRRAR